MQITKKVFSALLLMASSIGVNAQKIIFTEYDLPNGLHVILHQDKKAPVVAVSVMYHVGSKNEDPQRTGFAHFFEHLLFEGTDNIPRGQFFKYVSANGGQNNANTTQDRTFYFEIFPSNQLKLGLWLESERMLHPVINEIGVRTQNEVVKEEKRTRIDNQPYGHFTDEIFKRLFVNHPYKWQPIGSMANLDSAKLDEFKSFFKKFYVPNNAVLSIAGDIDLLKTKQLVAAYFSDIPKGNPVVQPHITEAPITKQMVDTAYDVNIKIPAIMTAYRIPGLKTRDADILELISNYLSGGASSKFYKKMVDDKKNSLQVGSFNYTLEDYGAYITYALPNNNTGLDTLLNDMDVEIANIQNNLISLQDYNKLMNRAENDFVNSNTRMLSPTGQGVAGHLAESYIFYGNTNHINEELNDIKKITREDIRDVAKKYLNKNQRLVLYYLPKTTE
ncbi:hypothetical protein BH09BAC2_BH09BAC2_20100 [soil metagenome]